MNNKSVALAPSVWVALILLLSAAMYGLRLVSPSDLEGYAQYRNIGYVLDAVHHGEWITQHDLQGRILSKPPLHTWLITPSVHVFGHNRFALTLPSFVAVTALGLLVFFIGRRQFGLLAGGLAGIFLVLAPLYSKQLAMVRSDPVFAFFITAGMWAAWRAWKDGRGWTIFWFIGGLGTLTKGPLALLLAVIGLTAYFWEKRTQPEPPRLRGSHWPGLLVFFGVCFAWLIPALLKGGRELVDMMLIGELVGQASGVSNDKIPLSHLPEPTLNLLSRFAPFSLLAFYGLWRVFRRPSGNAEERRFERFVAFTLLGGLLVFSLAAHFRSDLIVPLLAPAALLAGREGARLADRAGTVGFACMLTVIVIGLFGFAWWTYHPTSGSRHDVIVQSEDVKAAAAALRKSTIPVDELVHIETPSTLQFYLRTAHICAEPQNIRNLSINGHPPRWLAIGSAAEERALEKVGAKETHEVFRWPRQPTAVPLLTVYELIW